MKCNVISVRKPRLPNKSLKTAHIRSLDSFSRRMLRILCAAFRCPLALRYAAAVNPVALVSVPCPCKPFPECCGASSVPGSRCTASLAARTNRRACERSRRSTRGRPPIHAPGRQRQQRVQHGATLPIWPGARLESLHVAVFPSIGFSVSQSAA